jgi:O-antigen ligase
VSALAGRSGRYLLQYGGALLLALVVGATVAYSERFGGDNGIYMLLGVLLVVAAAGAILLQWRIGALLLAAALPFEVTLAFGPGASGIKVLASLTFVSFALALLTDRKHFERFARLWQQPLALAVLAFVLWGSTSIFWATSQGEALRGTITYLGLLGLMVVIGSLEMRYLVLVWTVLVFSAALTVPAGYILPVPEGSDMAVSGRFGPGGAGPNTYSLDLAIAFFAAFFGSLSKHRIIVYLLTPVFFYGIFATESRTGLIALVATPLLALFVPRLGARLGWRTLPMYLLGVAAIAVMFLAIPSVAEPALERYTTLSQIESEDTWNGRADNWHGALEVIAAHPILGVGMGNYAEAAMNYSESVQQHSESSGEVTGATHNLILGIASELGIVGLILFLTMVFLAFKTAWLIAQKSDLGTAVFLGLIVAIIGGMAQPWEQHKLVYFLFGSVLALQLHYSGRSAPSADEHERHT